MIPHNNVQDVTRAYGVGGGVAKQVVDVGNDRLVKGLMFNKGCIYGSGPPMYMPGAMAQAERATEVTAKSRVVFIRIGQFYVLMGVGVILAFCFYCSGVPN